MRPNLKWLIVIAQLSMFVCAHWASEPEESSVLLSADFEDLTSNRLAKHLLSHPAIELAEGAGPDGSNAIRVAYVGYPRGSQRVVVRHPLAARVQHASLSFDLRFDEDFQWTLGGKLHGLGPQRPVTGGKPRQPNGWSARIMFKKEGACATYLYEQSPYKTYGIGRKSKGPVFRAGQWHHVVLEVGLNTPGESDGWARIRVDGQEVVLSENVNFRGVGGTETDIQQLLFSTFHGGSSPQWSPVDANGDYLTLYALYDNIVVSEIRSE